MINLPDVDTCEWFVRPPTLHLCLHDRLEGRLRRYNSDISNVKETKSIRIITY